MKKRLISITVLLLIFIYPLASLAQGDTVAVTVTVERIVSGVVSAPPGQRGDPGDILVYIFTVQNTGNGPDTFILRPKSSERWSVSLPGGKTTKRLAPGEVQSVNMELTIPADEIAGTIDILTLSAISQTDRMISSQDSVSTTVNQVAGVLVTAPRGQSGKPGQIITYDFTVQNTGNGRDRFSLDVASSQGWMVNLPGGNIIGPLNPGIKERVRVELTISFNATGGTVDMFTLKATSKFVPSVSAQDSVITKVRGGAK